MPVTATTTPRQPWEQEANCLGLDPELFFPESGVSPAEAKAVCAGCQVRDDCLGLALAENVTYGVWGGLTAAERQRLGRRRGLRAIR
jgi:WhiB family transcriptional regulator, redox-sensing transcriptional regulator